MSQHSDVRGAQEVDATVAHLIATYGEGGIWPTEKQWRALLERPGDEQVFVMHFFKFRDRAVYPDDPGCTLTGEEAALGKYIEVAAPSGASKDAQVKVTYVGRNPQIVIGAEEDWDLICVFEYPNRRAFLSVFLNEEYSRSRIHRNAGALRHRTVITAMQSTEYGK